MATTFPIKNGVLQGDLDAANFGILNLDKTSLGLVKADVGLGNVDNTSDLNKPVSTATQTALSLKENNIAAGLTSQFWIGNKTWQTFGALALQGGATTLQELSAKTANATGSAFIAAKRNDYASSFAGTYLQHYGASAVGTTLGLSNANLGELVIQNAAFALIRTNGPTPLIFGYNNQRRMRLMQGLNVGGDGDPGAGCITCYDKMTTAHFLGTDLVLTGDGSMQDLILTGSATVAGSVTTTLGMFCGQNMAIGGNLVASGSIVNFDSLPTSDPAVDGQLWRSGNDVKISTG